MKRKFFNNYCHVKTCIFITILFICVSNGISFGDENNKSFFITGIENEQTHAMAKEVLKEAYRRLGYEIKYEFLPGKRSLIMANSGESDGDIARIKGTEKAFRHLVPVPIPIIWFKGVVFTKKINKNIKDWYDLKGLKIGIIRGIRYSEIGTQDLSPLFADDMTHLFKLLDQDMIQVAIATQNAGRLEINRNHKGSDIHVIGEPLFSAPLYHFVNMKNKSIVLQLNLVLQDMEQHGEIKKILVSTFTKMLNSSVLNK